MTLYVPLNRLCGCYVIIYIIFLSQLNLTSSRALQTGQCHGLTICSDINSLLHSCVDIFHLRQHFRLFSVYKFIIDYLEYRINVVTRIIDISLSLLFMLLGLHHGFFHVIYQSISVLTRLFQLFLTFSTLSL